MSMNPFKITVNVASPNAVLLFIFFCRLFRHRLTTRYKVSPIHQILDVYTLFWSVYQIYYFFISFKPEAIVVYLVFFYPSFIKLKIPSKILGKSNHINIKNKNFMLLVFRTNYFELSSSIDAVLFFWTINTIGTFIQ